jgi:uncharacterized protein YuzE
MEATIENIDKLDVSYDKQRDVLYISFGEPREADESKLTENDIVIRYIHGKVVGRLTIISSQKDYHLDTKQRRQSDHKHRHMKTNNNQKPSPYLNNFSIL